MDIADDNLTLLR